MSKPKRRCPRCGSLDLQYGTSQFFKREVKCKGCGDCWQEGRTAKSRRRYEREVLGK